MRYLVGHVKSLVRFSCIIQSSLQLLKKDNFFEEKTLVFFSIFNLFLPEFFPRVLWFGLSGSSSSPCFFRTNRWWLLRLPCPTDQHRHTLNWFSQTKKELQSKVHISIITCKIPIFQFRGNILAKGFVKDFPFPINFFQVATYALRFSTHLKKLQSI